MIDETLNELLRAGESQTVAFAPATAADDAAKAGNIICSFANGQGGMLIIAAESGTVPDAAAVIQRLRVELLNRLSPHVAVGIRQISVQQRTLLVVDVPGGWDLPYTFDRQIFVRVGAHTRAADGIDVRDLLAKKASLGPRWERQIAAGVSLHDLDAPLLLRVATEAEGGKLFLFARPRRSAIEILRELDLAEGDLLRNSAYAIFGVNPDKRFPQMRIRAVAYRGTDQDTLDDSQMIRGNLYEILDKGLRFLKSHAPISSEIPRHGLRREQKPPFPFPAMREALLNAVIHRDYAPADGSASISIFSDRVEIWNIGDLPEGMDLSELRQVHASRPRNPDIAHLFMLHGQIERIGSGTRRIIREFRAAGLPEPKWYRTSGGILLVLPREKIKGLAAMAQDLNPRQRAVLKSLRAGQVIRFLDYLEHSPERVGERQVREDLKKLVEMGFLDRRGQARQTEYVRTDKQLE